ncbi:GHKL domain-containing protein [Neglecta sp. X4]|uniref:sensor histidine kinase n=1 Tax=unclassified Neglectibacter TaxID=2632164 RepID=UPI00136F2DA0|nr:MULTISPECIES: GHKL domain-containing protein [unclassified Neglectibacter]NBI18003.1 GHKL domain-containing protein [Neglectibacter sp. 59]NBJ73600.1 GHKL domain-containing protein [Neglectibacter sp. X4]NBK79669.1 GHKL domain-containing protein [bacterium D16-76]NCE81385.1 GHKL domain-containing protein [Neglectibacter sp. X58]
MDYFSLIMDGISILGQGIMHIFFVSRLTGKGRRLWHFAVYCLALCVIQCLSLGFKDDGIISIAAGILGLYTLSRFALGNQRPISWVAAVLAFYVSQLSFGIINSVEVAFFPGFIGTPQLYLLLLVAQALYFVACIGCYRAVRKLLAWTQDSQTPYIGLLLLPGLFFFGAELYILQTAYSFFVPSVSLEDVGKHGTLFFLQITGLAALLCTLYAYRQLCRGFQAQVELQSLTQAAQAQKVYIAEARARYEQTKSFRHDIKNHLSVLDGLLKNEKLDEGREYLKKLETVSEALSFPYQTGNQVVDILLGEKLGLAKEITAEVSLVLPNPCGIDDFDLCVLFANVLDNAITACRAQDGAKSIRISGKRQGDFYMLTFENTCSQEPLPPAGTGLSNIRVVAEKYHGAVLTEKTGGWFSLNVLLNVAAV